MCEAGNRHHGYNYTMAHPAKCEKCDQHVMAIVSTKVRFVNGEETDE
jgi:hypothetical protein